MKPNTLINRFNAIHEPFRLRITGEITGEKVQLVSASNGAETVHMEVWKQDGKLVTRQVYFLSWRFPLDMVMQFLQMAEKYFRLQSKRPVKEKK